MRFSGLSVYERLRLVVLEVLDRFAFLDFSVLRLIGRTSRASLLGSGIVFEWVDCDKFMRLGGL